MISQIVRSISYTRTVFPKAVTAFVTPSSAMLAFTWEASRRVVREAWITAAGDFYFLLGEDRQNKIYGDGYDETEQVYRELYTRLRDLADACIEMSHGDGSRPLKKSE